MTDSTDSEMLLPRLMDAPAPPAREVDFPSTPAKAGLASLTASVINESRREGRIDSLPWFLIAVAIAVAALGVVLYFLLA